SALALAEDVEHWLADEPVSAYPEPAVVRLRRWGRQHRTAVAAAAALVLTLTVALAVGLAAVNAGKNHTAAALLQVEQEQARTVAALAAESAARRQTRLALNKLTDAVVVRLMARQVQLNDQDRKFLREVQGFYERFAAATEDSVEGRAAVADGHH